MESPSKLIDSSKAVKIKPLDADMALSLRKLSRKVEDENEKSNSPLRQVSSKKSISDLKDYPNPASLVNLKYTNRGVSSIADICVFKNLVTG
jgi:hypothetical protein